MFAKYREGGGRGPVLQRGFFEVLDAVQARRQPVAAGHHFARYLGIATFVGVDQAALFQRAEPGQGKDHDQGQQGPAAQFDQFAHSMMSRGSHVAPFGHQDVVGAAGGEAVHHLDADATLDQGPQQAVGGEVLARTGAEQDDGAGESRNGLEVGFSQAVERRRRPVSMRRCGVRRKLFVKRRPFTSMYPTS
jgi:hypothetical protein